ncbi:ABC transporter permease [Roseomonas marmotae]|uniref:ABC transporter permease n=1 Tax=Roseomonas marmotae TaxID=2768161 RepID=A0ABS3KAU7_9PROT|nr:ABC transporter permease [Roseomonas marmotae]MBO1074593.1 ABC transporter permease [Roseomonas marmotae]QTI81620.1 ABC transporter permease [Roseomonas marmotae]
MIGARFTHWLLLLPSLLLLVLLLGLPLVAMLGTGLQPNVLLDFEGPALDNYAYLLSRSYYLQVIWRTLRMAAETTLYAIPLGYLAAMLLQGLSGRAGNLAIMGLTFPILAGPLTVVLGWMALLADGGPFIGPLVSAGVIPPLRLLGTEAGVVISLVQFVLPFTVLTLFTGLRQIQPQMHEAARSLGAGSTARFLHVTLPLSLPSVLSASIITFSLAASSFISPHYLGGAGQLTLTTLVSQFIMATFNAELAAAAAGLLLLLMLASVVAITALLGRLIRP